MTNISGIVKLIRRGELLEKQTVHLFSSRCVFKIAWGSRAALFDREFRAYTDRNQTIFKDLGVFYRPVAKRPFTIGRAPLLVKVPVTRNHVDCISQILLDRMSCYTAKACWSQTLEIDAYQAVRNRLSAADSQVIDTMLTGLTLPVTGAHGDLCPSNIFCDPDGSLKLIDWECYRSYGSAVTDLLRLHVRFAKRHNPFSQFCAREILNSGALSSISQRLQVSEDRLSVLAAVTNTCFPATRRWHPETRARRLDVSGLT